MQYIFHKLWLRANATCNRWQIQLFRLLDCTAPVAAIDPRLVEIEEFTGAFGQYWFPWTKLGAFVGDLALDDLESDESSAGVLGSDVGEDSSDGGGRGPGGEGDGNDEMLVVVIATILIGLSTTQMLSCSTRARRRMQ